MSDRAWTILGAGGAAVGIGLTVFFGLPKSEAAKWFGVALILGGILIIIYSVVNDRISSNKMSLVFSAEPPYTFHDAKYKYQVEYRLGVRGSSRVPKDVKVLVINIQPRPTESPHFRADYPYQLPFLSPKDDRELLFQLGTTWISSEGDLIFCGIQMESNGEFAKLHFRAHEIWDVAIRVIAADAKSIEAWFLIAAVNGSLRVRRHQWTPAGL
jgi:hypothetical protein